MGLRLLAAGRPAAAGAAAAGAAAAAAATARPCFAAQQHARRTVPLLAPGCGSSSGCRAATAVRAGSSKAGGGGGSSLARSVRAMPIKLISVSKRDSRAAQAMADEWVAKLGRCARVRRGREHPA